MPKVIKLLTMDSLIGDRLDELNGAYVHPIGKWKPKFLFFDDLTSVLRKAQAIYSHHF
jgi:hypothetical protein